ncbi:hypothetical protein ABZX90_36865 [Streptomyces sp. NPDC002935]|uniref:hypothetical protein n=1 Tax=Streptomyces sp. NPDC002935 TaxID=3154545 RepID=UPI0033BC9261
MTEEPQTEDPMVAALLRERAGYAGRGMDDRVAQVDEQLALRGHKPTGKDTQTPTRSTPPKGRQQRSPEKT